MKYFIIDYADNLILLYPAEARGAEAVGSQKRKSKLWWFLLKKVRTYYQENPDDPERL